MTEEKKKDSWDASGTLFVACCIIGVGLGLAFGKLGVGAILGVGFGFAAMAILKLYNKDRQ
ncbi:MAG: hypothetical protein SH856_07635 [Flavobacteriales bacterium]|nr:hypothetical protein [Flavobacteriales bacterium]